MGANVLVDAVGVRHEPARGTPRIVSLVPSLTELLFDLGLDPWIVGRTHFCVHPRGKVAALPSVGGTKKVNLARLRGLRPTHVVLNVDENTEEMAREVARFVPHVIVTHPIEAADNLTLFRLFGGVFRREERAEALARSFRAAHRELVRAARAFPPRRVVYLIWKSPWMTVSRETYVSRVLALARMETVPGSPDAFATGKDADARYPAIEFTPELLDEADYVLFSSEPYAFTDTDIEEFRRRYGKSRARLAPIDGELVSWYGSRSIAGLGYLRDFAASLP